jgi:CubicO group peptidase (beta-lactamase class C family)
MFPARRSRREILAWSTLAAAPALAFPSPAGQPPRQAGAGDAQAVAANAKRAADEIVAPWMAAHGAPGAVLGVLRAGRPILKWRYGVRSFDDPTPPDDDTIFHIASIAKTVTGHALMLLVQDGRIALDAPAITYLPELPPAWAPITVRQFLGHVSGIRNTGAFFGSDWLAALAAGQAAGVDPPGVRFRYVNFNYAVLGKVVERVSGQSYADFVKARIFDPLKMTRTFVGRAEHANQARGYLPSKTGWFTPTRTMLGADYWSAAGWMQSTLNDVLVFVAAVASRRLVREPVWSDAMRAYGPQMQGAAGWFAKSFAGEPTWEKLGRIAGFSADAEFNARGDAIVLMWNCQTYRDDSIVARVALRQRLLGLGNGTLAGSTSSVVTEHSG